MPLGSLLSTLLLCGCVCSLVDVRTDTEAMRKFSHLLFKESSIRMNGMRSAAVTAKHDDGAADAEYIDLMTSFFWGQEEGVVMEVGALDGVRLSQSRYLLDLNWRRILIEGSPAYKQRLKRSSPDALSFNAAICQNSSRHGPLHFVHTQGGKGGIVELMDRRFLDKYHSQLRLQSRGERDERWKSLPNVYQITCESMAKIINQTQLRHINALILDVGGVEFEVLQTIAFHEVCIDVLIIETDETRRPSGSKSRIQEYLKRRNYIFIADKDKNSWYRHNSFTPLRRHMDTFPFNRDNYMPQNIDDSRSELDKKSTQYRLFNLPAFPATLPQVISLDDLRNAIHVTPFGYASFTQNEKDSLKESKLENLNRNVPRYVWVSTSTTPPILPQAFQEMITRNPLWTIVFFNSSQQESFIDKFYANTNTREVFHLINPILWASRSDVWRQAILYAFGGLYLDFDAQVTEPLDSFIYANDSFIYSYERSSEGFVNRYQNDYHLSLIHGDSEGGRNAYVPSLVQWMIIAKRRCVFIERTLRNIVELVGKEFMMGWSAVLPSVQKHVRLLMFYTTGPLVFTASVKEVLLESNASQDKYNSADVYHRVYLKTNFRQVGAKHLQERSYSNEVKMYMEENHGYSPRLLNHYSFVHDNKQQET